MSEVAGARPTRRRGLIIALTVSLAVNLFLIGGIAGTIHLIRAEMGPRRFLEHAAATLHLTPDQQAALQHFQATMRERGRVMRHSNHEVWRALADPSTGNDKVAGLLDQGLANKTAFEKDMTTAFGQFLTSLTPAQRAEFISRVEAQRRYHGPFNLFKRRPH